MSDFKLDYTASEINQKLGEIDKKLETVDWGGISLIDRFILSILKK